MKKLKYILAITVILSSVGCEKMLEEEVFSQLATENYLATEAGLESVLYQAYNLMQRNGHDFTIVLHSDLVMTGRGDGKLGAWEGSTIAPFRSWNWLPTQWNLASNWNINYDCIYSCNTILDNLENGNFSDEFKARLKGQALALRGHAYYLLYDYYGPVVINTTTETTDDLNRPRATEQEVKDRIESDLLEASSLLPVDQPLYGQITKGGALGLLCKFYLNTKQWQKCADVAQQVIDLNKYSLFPDITTLCYIENEGNGEVIWVQPCANLPGHTNTLGGLTYPIDYPFPGTQSAWPALIYIPDWFVDSYLPGDKRADMLLKEYVNNKGITKVGYGSNKSLCIKYGMDPNADGGNGSFDFIEIRYADILLSRAEALNELNGPTQESIDLINMIRERADIPDLVLADVGSKDELRELILQERDWEFHFEGKTRQDLIRHGKLISDAQARGITIADEHHLLYPIPQTEMDANPNMVQNEGY